MKPFKQILFLSIVLTLGNFAFAQTAEREKGIELYNKGDYDGAIKILRQVSKKDDKFAETRNMLGLAYLKNKKLKESQKALEEAVENNPQSYAYRINLAYVYLLGRKFAKAEGESEKAIALNPKNADAYYIHGTADLWQSQFEKAIDNADKAIAVNPNFNLAYTLKADALLYLFGRAVGNGSKPSDKIDYLRQATEVLENCLKNCQNNSAKQTQEEKLAGTKAFHNYFSRDTSATIQSLQSPVTDNNSTPVKILAKPRPNYTDDARQSQVQGIIKAAVLFSSDGKIQYVMLLKGLGSGLDREALLAASKIKFEPATKNGKPISVIKLIEYSFAIY